MAKRKVVISALKGPLVAGGNPAKAIASRPVDPLYVPQPKIPKPVKFKQNGDGLLVFDGQQIQVELTGIIQGKGGAPKVVVTEYEGRSPRTALDPADLGTLTVPLIVKANAQYVHDVIVARAKAGHVLRVYGPMIGPYGQGDVWCFPSMPEPEYLEPGNPDGTIRAFRLTLELQEWSPMGSLVPTAGSRVGTDTPRKKAVERADIGTVRKGPDGPFNVPEGIFSGR